MRTRLGDVEEFDQIYIIVLYKDKRHHLPYWQTYH